MEYRRFVLCKFEAKYCNTRHCEEQSDEAIQTISTDAFLVCFADARNDGGREPRERCQSNRLDTDSSAAVRAIASEIRPAIERVRMLGAFRIASVGMMESVMTNS